nr:MAG TPA: Inositol-1-monophosphatase [Caudoviricetes sp.]
MELIKDGVTHNVTDEVFIQALRNAGFKTPEELAEEDTTEIKDVKEGDE